MFVDLLWSPSKLWTQFSVTRASEELLVNSSWREKLVCFGSHTVRIAVYCCNYRCRYYWSLLISLGYINTKHHIGNQCSLLPSFPPKISYLEKLVSEVTLGLFWFWHVLPHQLWLGFLSISWFSLTWLICFKRKCFFLKKRVCSLHLLYLSVYNW